MLDLHGIQASCTIDLPACWDAAISVPDPPISTIHRCAPRWRRQNLIQYPVACSWLSSINSIGSAHADLLSTLAAART